MKEYGFYMYFRGQDNFFKSKHQRITKKLTREILSILLPNADLSDSLIERAQKDIYKCTYEEKALLNGRKYCDIYGDNFGYGDFLDNYRYNHYYVLSE